MQALSLGLSTTVKFCPPEQPPPTLSWALEYYRPSEQAPLQASTPYKATMCRRYNAKTITSLIS